MLKKNRKRILGGIESKIVILILVAIVLVAGVFILVTMRQSKMLSELTMETSRKQQISMSETTDTVNATVIQQDLDRITELVARETDEMFRDVAIRVQMVGDYARKLLENPENVPRVEWYRPDPDKDGELFVKGLLAEGVEVEDVDDQMRVIANLSDLMVSVCEAYGTNNIWFSLPDGMGTLMADTVPSEWVEKDDSYRSYDAWDRYWFRQAAEAGGLVFSDIEYDKRTGEMCVTCALPVYNDNGELLGVAGADLYLAEMQRTVEGSTENGGFLIVINQNGHVIVSPDENGIFQVHESEDAPDLRNSENEELAALVGDALQGKTDVRKVHLPDGNYYMIGVPMETVGWAMIAAYSESVAELPFQTLKKNYEQTQQEATSTYRVKSAKQNTIAITILAIVLIIMVVGALLAGGKIVRPLGSMTRQIAKLGGDNLEFKMKDSYRTGDEVEVLAESFADLSHKTVEYFEQVRQVTAEKERIGTELHLAQQIQEGMLPSIFPPYPERHEFDLYAAMDPAKEVGGDFYDFFLIDSDHLALVMADVSGKGIPAALFMMVSKAILKNNAMMGKTAGEVLTVTNETICANNKMEMFVTVWLGILEISTGKITAANAGHEYPAIFRNGGQFELFKDKHGFVIGGMEGVRYREYEIALQPGDKLFLYTDGVPEATNKDQELFGTERMIAALNKKADMDPTAILKGVRESVDIFVDGAEQFDDLTMLCLEYRGPGKEQTTT